MSGALCAQGVRRGDGDIIVQRLARVTLAPQRTLRHNAHPRPHRSNTERHKHIMIDDRRIQQTLALAPSGATPRGTSTS